MCVCSYVNKYIIHDVHVYAECVCVCVYVCVCAFVIRVNRGDWPVSHQWIGETHPTVELHGF